MAQRGTGTITVDGKTKSFGSPATMPTMAQSIENPEEARMKKFYTEQYNIEAQNFAKQKMSQTDFDKGIGNLQTKYKLAYNKAKMQADRPDPAYKQYSELDIYRNKLESNAKQFRVQPSGKIPSWWKPRRWEETAPEELEIFDPSKLAYDAKGNVKEGSVQGAWRKAKLDEIQAYGLIKEELGRVTEEQNMLLRPKTSSLMNTAVKSPRIGGSIKDQTKALIEQRQGNAQQQTDNDPLGLR